MKITVRCALALLIGVMFSAVLFGQALSVAPSRSAELREEYELALAEWTAVDTGIEKGLLQQDPSEARQRIILARRRWLMVSKAKIEMLQYLQSEVDRTAVVLDAEPTSFSDPSFRNQLSNRLKKLEEPDAVEHAKPASTPQQLLLQEQQQRQTEAIQRLKRNLRVQVAALDDLGASSTDAARVRRSLRNAVSDASHLLDQEIDLAKAEEAGFVKYYDELESLVNPLSQKEPARSATAKRNAKKESEDDK